MNKKKKDGKELNNGAQTAYILTKETFGMSLLLFSALVLLMLFTGSGVFAGIGTAICAFMYGTFGYGSILLVALTAYLGEWLIFGKKIKLSLSFSIFVCLTVFFAFLLFHSVTSRNISSGSYGAYISGCYESAEKGFSGYTFGGALSALFVYPVAKPATFVGAYIIFSLFIAISGYFLFISFKNGRRKARTYSNAIDGNDLRRANEFETENEARAQSVAHNPAQEPAPAIKGDAHTTARENEDDNPYSQKNLGRKIIFAKGEFDAESYKRNMIFNENSYFNHPITNQNDYLSNFYSGKKNSVPEKSYGTSYQEAVLNQPASSAPSHYVYGDKPVDVLNDYEQASGGIFPVQKVVAPESDASGMDYSEFEEEREELSSETVKADDIYSVEDVEEDAIETSEPPVIDLRSRSTESEQRKPERDSDNSVSMYNLFGNVPRGENRVEPDITRISARRQESSNANLFDDDNDDDFADFGRESRDDDASANDIKLSEERRSIREGNANRIPQPSKEIPKAAEEEKPKHIWKKYIRPGIDLLNDYPEHSNVNAGEIEDNKTAIVETLLKFKTESEIANVIIGPAVTRYDVVIPDRTKNTQSLRYKEAIAMALMKDNVTAYLNFSKGALSIEVPNNVRTIVGLKSMLVSSKFINCKPNSITFALGKNVEGEAVCADITKMPHLLIAGTTGSGKSICLSALIVSLLYKYGPEELRFILVDPKQVEFISYDKLPHLMINEIIYEVDKAIKALNWAIKEMERRYSLFKDMTEKGVATKNLDEYNAHLPEGEEKLPKIVIILDEFGDLMLQAKKDIEGRIIKLVQKARACGIHLILATQRPSVDCITGLIKSNLPTRIGFKVNSFDDARTIFDIGGAEKLLGKGDMYFRSAESPDLARIQGCFIDTPEVQRVTDFVKAHNETYFDQSVADFINTVEEEQVNAVSGDEASADGGDMKIDDTYIKALYYCVTSNQASVSMIQRRFPVGYIKACKIIDWMENMNYVTQSEGSKPRKVILSKDEFLNTYGEVDD